jgi:hypothetical protein
MCGRSVIRQRIDGEGLTAFLRNHAKRRADALRIFTPREQATVPAWSGPGFQAPHSIRHRGSQG